MDNAAAIRETPLQSIVRCVALWGALVRNSFVRQLEFRADFAGRIVVEFVWLASQLLTFVAAYRFTDNLAGWNRAEMGFFLGSLITIDGLYTIFLYPNQNKFGSLLRNGQLDFYLLYPLPTVFLAFFRFVNVHGVINVALGVALLVWQLSTATLSVNWILWGIYMLLGTLTVACVGIFVTTLGFWTTQTTNLVWFFFELYRLGFRPENFYRPWMRRFLLSVFPAAFFFSIPAQISLGKLGGAWLLYPWLVAGACVALVAILWKRGIQRYEGALS